MSFSASYDVDIAKKYGVSAASLYNKLIFLSRHTKREDKYCFKTAKEIEDELGITPRVQMTAISKLEEGGLIVTKNTYIMGTRIKCKHFYVCDRSVVGDEESDLYKTSKSDEEIENADLYKTLKSENTQSSESDSTDCDESLGNSQTVITKHRNSYILTTPEKKEKFDNALLLIKEKLNRPLGIREKLTCKNWIEENYEPEMIELAVEDNLFRGDGFGFKYVTETLKAWKKKGITNIIQARNFVLDHHVANIKLMASRKERELQKDGLEEEILDRNRYIDLQSWRDELNKLYRIGLYDELIKTYELTSRKEVLDYLSEEIQDLIISKLKQK